MPYLVLVWVHVLAAITWIGGMAFVGAVLAPVARDLPAADRASLLHRVGVRFSAVGWTCIGVLLATGPWMLAIRGRLWILAEPGRLGGSAFSHLLLAKLGVIFVMVLLSLSHDFWLGPKLVGALAASGDPQRADPLRMRSLRRRVALLARVNLGLGVLVVALGIMLGRL